MSVEKETIQAVLDNLFDNIEKQRRENIGYKQMFDATDGMKLCSLVEIVENETTESIMNAAAAIEDRWGIHVSNDLFHFLLALPYLLVRLERDIEQKEGSVCCVDKTYSRLINVLKQLISECKKK